jgi:hypothetical protein
MKNTEYNIYNFLNICNDFVESSRELRDAAMLCDDEVKQEMISFIIPTFEEMCARSEGVKILLKKENYSQNKEFVLAEMKAVTHQNFEMAKSIREKLGSLK